MSSTHTPSVAAKADLELHACSHGHELSDHHAAGTGPSRGPHCDDHRLLQVGTIERTVSS